MNSLFRKIKENSNLDLLETSDSEDDFDGRFDIGQALANAGADTTSCTKTVCGE